ncbi:mechanosensitive ion channel [Alloscardovia omnicolens]|uniref:mechanosensitive ion channel family protein n=1 Tax=Alloscardovia omnicolens TaxID=419015 RepID=UPI00254BF231|nr:mechanosensitive ion channel domain-containing protein [Alloscardovia omnicolens]MDK6663564.1 mechanosensitive ion channel [Alloscardovia omnicolens]MDK7747664.1 mechanosensitive ion channel [Alloscardovia omnicolens]
MNNIIKFLTNWVNNQTDRFIFLAITIVVTALISHFVAKAMHALLDRSPLPSASLFINVTRSALWVIAFIIVLKPVFGVEANSLITALGVGGVAISLGMQDTISNIISGFGLMAGRVIKPGDRVVINNIHGTVKDVTWRHTVVIERNGNEMWIPNSVLNTASLEKILRSNEAYTTLRILLKPSIDVRSTVADIVRTVQTATLNYSLKGTTPTVRLVSFTAYGIEANVVLYAKERTAYSVIHDSAARALAGKPYLASALPDSGEPTASTVPLDNIQLPDLVSTQILRTPLVDNAMEGASAAKKKVVDTGVTTVVQKPVEFPAPERCKKNSSEE